MLSARNIQCGEIQFDNFRLISEEDFALEHRRTQVATNDVLLTIVGTIGRVAVVPKNAPAFSLQRSVAVLKPTAAVTSKYLAYTLESPRTQQKFLESAKGTAQKGVYLKTLGELEVDLAPLPEQTRIADQLDTLLARVNACNNHLDAIPGILKRFRQAVLNAATSGALTDDWRKEDAAPWREVLLSDVAFDFSYGSAAKSAKVGTVPVLRMGNIQRGRLDWSDLVYTSDPNEIEKYKLTKGDVLFNRTNSPELVGKAAVYEGGRTAIYAGYLIRVRCAADVLPEYLNYCLGSKRGRDYCWSVKSDGVSQSNINAKKLAAFPFALPPPDEQKEIVRRAEALLALAKRIESRYTVLVTHARRLAPQVLAKAFRGELVEQDPQDEPASVLLERLATSQPTEANAPRGRPRAQPKAQPSARDCQPLDWATLPDGVWAAPADPDGQAAAVWLTAVLRAWGEPMPERTARLATLLCQHPHLFIPALPAAQAKLWSRLVGDEALPLPANVARFQPATNSPWGRAILGMRMRSDLVEAGTGDDVTWALGPGAAAIATAGWPDGRAGFVVAHLRAHGLASILPALASAEQAFVDARAA